jgi:CheY-like chemotaxis protein
LKLEQAIILLVDDEPALLDILANWLRGEGAGTVLTAKDGEEAQAILAQSPVDLLISDVRMPRVDGLQLVRSLHTLPHPLPSIIFVSGFGELDRREMHGLGVEAFLAKPFQRGELLGTMRRALAGRVSLWSEPLPAPPRQSMAASGACLGRGGFSAHCQHPLSLSNVEFECKVDQTELVLRGQGIVRWYAHAEGAAGVEFIFLDAECRAWVAQRIEETSPRAFIPHSPKS